MQEIFIAAVYFLYLALGLGAPFVAGLGYIWVDLFSPQQVAPNAFGGFPVAMVAAIAALFAYIAFDRRHRPRISFSILLFIIFATWMTLTRIWAIAPDADEKWSWAFKVMAFSAFIPFIIRSRIQIEAVIWTMVVALSGNILAVAAKTVITGGGYGARTALVVGNSGLAEGSTLSMLSVAMMPLILFIKEYSVLFFSWRHKAVLWILLMCCAITSVGLFTRTGLVALVVFFILVWLKSRRKIVTAIAIILVACFALPLMGTSWQNRMSTIEDPLAEGSAAARIGVWRWTLEYVSEHPLGGGFNAYEMDTVELTSPEGAKVVRHGVAFHSIYFEILGEMGIAGFAIWGLLIFKFFGGMIRLHRQTAMIEGAEWLSALTTALMSSVMIYLAGGTFIGVGFQPTLYYLIAVSISAIEYWRRSHTEAIAGQGDMQITADLTPKLAR